MGLRDSAEVDHTIYSFALTAESSERGQGAGDNYVVDGHVRRSTAMHMLHSNHKFTIILPSCLHCLRGVSVFPLSSLLQNSKSSVTSEDVRTDLHSRKEVWRVP